MMTLTKIPTVLNFSGLSRYQAPSPKVPKYNMSRIKAFPSTFEENPKFLLFHSPNLFVYKLTSSSRASFTIIKYFKSQWWCLLNISSLPVLLYLENLFPRPYGFKSRTCAKILLYVKTSFSTWQKKKKNAGRKICSVSGKIFWEFLSWGLGWLRNFCFI